MIAVGLPLISLAAPPPPPDSGSLLQQSRPGQSQTPSPNDTGLQLPSPTRSGLPASAAFQVTRIEIDGNTVFDTKTLHDLIADCEGRSVTLQQLGEIVYRITDYYHHHGYLLARAIIPAQTMRNGAVRVSVIEARYGQIMLKNQSLAGDETLNGILSVLKAGGQVERTELDRSLLLLSDIPGVTSNSVVRPGDAIGTSDLLIDATATAAWSGDTLADNYGNYFTGRERLSGTINWIDPLHRGDVLSIYVLTAGQNMDNLALTYETQFGGQGARLGGSLSALHYALGGSLDSLQAHGIAQVGSLWIRYPWQRSVSANVYSQIQYDYKQLNDDIDSTGLKTNRHITNLTFSLNGDVRDNVLAGATTIWSAAWKAGQLGFDDNTAALANATTADTQGGFVKWNGSYTRMQNLSESSALQFALSAQWSNNNLDSAEKMVAGGAYSVRAYDMGALAGDSGMLGSFELHQTLPWSDSAGSWQGILFFDSEHVRLNQNPWTGGPNGASLSGAGLGLNWAARSGWHARFSVAAPVGSVPALIDAGRKARTWIELGSGF